MSSLLGRAKLEVARQYHDQHKDRYPLWLLDRLASRLATTVRCWNDEIIEAIACYQDRSGLVVDGVARASTVKRLLGHDLRQRSQVMVGQLQPGSIRPGKPRERYNLFQRRVRPRVFGEPLCECELTERDLNEHQPHVIAFDAWQRMAESAGQGGFDVGWLGIHSAYRSVAFQRQVFEYRLDERRRNRREERKPELPERELRRIQRKWTAEPGMSAHHTGFALDLNLYSLGRRAKRSAGYEWLAHNAARFGFYPYVPEGWHWEYNPPGLVEQVRELRRCIETGEPFEHLLRAPESVPV